MPLPTSLPGQVIKLLLHFHNVKLTFQGRRGGAAGERLGGGGLRDAEKRGWRQSEQKKGRWRHRNSAEGRGVENKRAERRRCLDRGEVWRD